MSKNAVIGLVVIVVIIVLAYMLWPDSKKVETPPITNISTVENVDMSTTTTGVMATTTNK